VKSETIWNSEGLADMDVHTMPAATAGTVPTASCVLPVPPPKESIAPSARNVTQTVLTLNKKVVAHWKNLLMSAMDVLTGAAAP
jgi:hypothetical protein